MSTLKTVKPCAVLTGPTIWPISASLASQPQLPYLCRCECGHWRGRADALLGRLGILLLQGGADADAILLLQRALAADPDREEVYYHLGQALLRRGEAVRGRKLLDYFHLLQQEHQKLLAHKTAVVLNPNDADAYYKLGVVYARIGRYEAASQAYQAALAVAPDHLDARNNLGNIYLRRRALGLAIAAYQEVLRRDPQYARAHYNLGNAYLLAGEEARAIAAFAKAVEADPEHRKAQQMLDNYSQFPSGASP